MTVNQTKNINFETAIAELEEVIQKLEFGEQPLEQAIELYNRGNALAANCDKLLLEAKLKVEKLVTENGKLSTKPFIFD